MAQPPKIQWEDDEEPNPVADNGEATAIGKADVDLELQPLTGAEEQPKQPERPQKPLWSVWPSRNTFCCKGALLTGGSDEFMCPNICVWSFIIIPSTFYFGWVFPALWHRGCYALPAFTLVIFLITSGSLLATCCSDPGIIPRREVIIATKDSQRLEAALGYDALGEIGENGAGLIPKNLSHQGYRWCRTCRIVRPPRASHCPDCDNCVLRYDHHCPFVNNCVGQRNYHFFFSFVTCVWCLALLVLPAILWFLTSRDIESTIDGLVKLERRRGLVTIVFYVLIAVGAIVVLAAVGSMILWFYHVFLIATNQTTKEQRRSISNLTEEPTLFAARGPRLFDPWAVVDPREILPELPPVEKKRRLPSKDKEYRDEAF